MGYIKLIIKDEEGKVLKHLYQRNKIWDVPAGYIEEGETAIQAAKRELLERAGFDIDEKLLKEVDKDGDYVIFESQKKYLKQIAEPGERFGYMTEIKWE